MPPCLDWSSPNLYLPRPLTSFVGREREVATVTDRLCRDDVCLVTLTGPGGVGKTRLAIRVAEAVSAEFPGGIWFVPLASVRDPDLIAPTLARALGLQESQARPLVEAIAAFLAGRRGLLILDNFEHVLDAAPLVTDLLVACPTLTVLATSQAVLRLSGEHAIAVPPLSLAGLTPTELWSQDADDPRMDASEAVRLFVERAIAADASFALTETNVADVTTLCRRLDGLPLAIELAAARVCSLPLPVMLGRLDQGLRLLIGGPRDQPVRLRAMRDAIAWSYDLLPPEEQVVFRHLAVVVGGCTIEAAEATIASGDSHRETIDRVAALVDKSLVRQELGAGSEARYFMLETIREFALERLVASGEEEAARQAHAAYYIALAEQADPHLIVPGQEVWLARLEADHDNFRAALTWFEASGEAGSALRLAGALRNLWLLHSHYVEGRRRLERALAAAPAAPAAWRARAFTGACILALYQGDLAQAHDFLTASTALWQELGDEPEVARLRVTAGVLFSKQGDNERAQAETEAALTALEALGDTALVARPLASMALSNLGHIALREGDPRCAIEMCTKALARQRDLDYTWGAVISLARIGDAAQQLGDIAQAAAAYRESLQLSRRLWDQRVIAWALSGLALVAFVSNPERAARLLGAVDQWTNITGVLSSDLARGPRRQDMETAARSELGDERFAAALRAGGAQSVQQVIDEAIAVAEAVLTSLSAGEPAAPARVAGLTPRELEVLRLVAAGLSNREIAATLFVSVSTVKRHLSTILGKLGLPSRSAATAYAHTHHLV
jgi:predicted ATPase/DNA-binding CsgD family transcriptional regulator